jgi:hypothetical protein
MAETVLACEIPEYIKPGDKFHIEMNGRYFEVEAPRNSIPGETINIIVESEPKRQSTRDDPEVVTEVVDDFENKTFVEALLTIGGRVLTRAKVLDETYKITDKIVEIATPAVEAAKTVDEKYKILEKSRVVGENAQTALQYIDSKFDLKGRAEVLLASTWQQLSALEKQNNILALAGSTGKVILALANEIDKKYAVSLTTVRLVGVGKYALVAVFQKALQLDAQLGVSDRTAAAIAAGAGLVAAHVTRFANKSSITGAPDDKQVTSDATEITAASAVAV